MKIFKFGCLGIVLIIVIAIIAAVVGGGGDSDSASSSSSTSSKKSESKKEYKVGQEVTVGKLTFKVNNVEEKKELTAQYLDTLKTDGKFAVVDITIKNNDSEARTLDSEMFRIIGKDGTEYKSYTEGDTYINDGDLGFFLQQVNPKMSKTGKVAFEIPNEEGYKLQVSSGLGWEGGKYETINLGK